MLRLAAARDTPNLAFDAAARTEPLPCIVGVPPPRALPALRKSVTYAAMSAPPPQPEAASAEALIQHALAAARAGRLHDAIHALRDARAKYPAHVALRRLLGVMLQQAGDDDAALRELDEAVALAPTDAALIETQASVLLAAQHSAAAEAAARAVLALEPQRAQATLTLALALDAQQRRDEAIAVLQKLLHTQPAHAATRQLLVRCFLASGDAEAALAAATHPAVLGDIGAARELAAEFCTRAPHAPTLALLRWLLQRHAHDYFLLLRMARTLHQAGRSSEALQFSERAHALAPQEVEPIEMRAVSLIDRGEVEAGMALYRELLARADVGAESASRHLILMHYEPALDNAALYAAHAAWTRRYIATFGTPFHDRRPREPARKLRVAWLSPRFSEGPVATFLTGLLGAFDRAGFEHCLVPLRATDAAPHARLRALAERWIDLRGLDDDELLEHLRAHEFDIAIDLAGHSLGHRLAVFAQRVAPIQLCWLDYFDTTAVAAMDGWISDAWLTPPDSSQRYSERLLRLEAGRFCYTPPEDAPDIARIGAGDVVFASFNRLAKLNDAVLQCWASILARVPGSRLELGAHLLDDEIARARTLQRCAAHGIGAERLRLHGARSYAQLLHAYREVDIALDPFPFSGCTTSCDALWMGVPVVALQGDAFVARQSASLLARLGRDEWIAADASEYVARAVRLAASVDALRAARGELRELMRTRLCDAAAQARDFATLLRGLWLEHCALP